MEMMVWNIVLTGLVGILGMMMKGKFDELNRIAILLNRTREEVARDHITRSELNLIVDRLGERLDKGIDRLEAKMDTMAGKR